MDNELDKKEGTSYTLAIIDFTSRKYRAEHKIHMAELELKKIKLQKEEFVLRDISAGTGRSPSTPGFE